MEMAKGVHRLSEDETAVSLMQECVRDQYCSIDALDIFRSICVTGGISGGATRKFGASERRNYRAHNNLDSTSA